MTPTEARQVVYAAALAVANANYDAAIAALNN
jgi:hypothetical protein